MVLVLLIDLIVIIALTRVAIASGLEAALPLAAFIMVAVPLESSIPLGFCELTTQRLVIMILLVLYLSVGRRQLESNVEMPMPLKFLIAVHIAWCALSTANSVEVVMSIKKAASVIAEYYILYFVYWKTLTRRETIRRILFAMVLALIVCSSFGAFEAYGADNVLEYFPKTGHHFDMNAETDREVRVQSTFDHPILFGAALSMAITMDLYLLTVTEKRWTRRLLWIGLFLMFLNIYKTSSRGPWLDVILSCLLLALLSRGKIRRYIFAIILLSVAAVIIRPGIWDTVKGIYDNSFDMNTSTGTSYQYRYALQHAVREKLLETPSRALWGYGLETFYDLQLEGDFLGKPHLFLSCDSSWAELMIETGFVGLSVMIMLLFRPLWRAFRDSRKLPRPEGELSLLFFVNLVVFYFQMYSVGMYSWGQNGYMLWIVIAMTFAYSRCLPEEEDTPMLLEAESEEEVLFEYEVLPA
ncbi:O-antigen ligase family protein [Silvibacterium acidisoli]|uniref:O-antigen ligase family protein n=1 Tax=Acidobacteriaceae bacterium ZG23-2 TaxID=2883246 RepID=UPI00406D48DC